MIFKSQGGLDFFLNYEYLSREDHRGDLGPHKNREVDLKYKRELEQNLLEVLPNKFYEIHELIDILELEEVQACKAFRQLKKYEQGISKEDVVKRLLGGRFYV